jgi:cysteine-rich repeat protein
LFFCLFFLFFCPALVAADVPFATLVPNSFHAATLETWVRLPAALPAALQPRTLVAIGGGEAGPTTPFLVLSLNPGSSEIMLHIRGSAGGSFFSSNPLPAGFAIGQWRHVAVSVSGQIDSVFTASFYVDGAIQGASTTKVTSLPSAVETPAPVFAVMGGAQFTDDDVRAPATSSMLRGDLDDVRFWDVARTQTEISVAMDGTDMDPGRPDRPAPRRCAPGLRARWVFDECPTGAVVGHPRSEPFAGISHGTTMCAAGSVDNTNTGGSGSNTNSSHGALTTVHRTFGAPERRVRYEIRNTAPADALSAVVEIVLRDTMLHVRDGYLDDECQLISFVLTEDTCPAQERDGILPGAAHACQGTPIPHYIDSFYGCDLDRPATGPAHFFIRVPLIRAMSSVIVHAVIGRTGFENPDHVFRGAMVTFDSLRLVDIDGPTHGSNPLPDPVGMGIKGSRGGRFYTGVIPTGLISRRYAFPNFLAAPSLHARFHFNDAIVAVSTGSLGHYYFVGLFGSMDAGFSSGAPYIAFGCAQPTYDNNNYHWFFNGVWADTNVPRSTGWHVIDAILTRDPQNGDAKITMSIDGVAFATDQALTSQPTRGRHYIDLTLSNPTTLNLDVRFDNMWTVPHHPHVLVDESACGDGVLASPEQCDDGNVIPHDGCSPTCHVERPWQCTRTSPSVCTGAPFTCTRALRLFYPNADLHLSNIPPSTQTSARVAVGGPTFPQGGMVRCYIDSTDNVGSPWMLIEAAVDGEFDVTRGRFGIPEHETGMVAPTGYSKIEDALVTSIGTGSGSKRIMRFRSLQATIDSRARLYYRTENTGFNHLVADLGFANLDDPDTVICAAQSTLYPCAFVDLYSPVPSNFVIDSYWNSNGTYSDQALRCVLYGLFLTVLHLLFFFLFFFFFFAPNTDFFLFPFPLCVAPLSQDHDKPCGFGICAKL